MFAKVAENLLIDEKATLDQPGIALMPAEENTLCLKVLSTQNGRAELAVERMRREKQSGLN